MTKKKQIYILPNKEIDLFDSFDPIVIIFLPLDATKGGTFQASGKVGYFDVISLYVLKPGDFTTDKTKAIRTIKKIFASRNTRSTFMHEFIHLLDSKRYGKQKKRKNDPDQSDEPYIPKSGVLHAKGDIQGYYNTPEEFNAFYQGLVADYERWVNSEDMLVKSNVAMQSDKEVMEAVLIFFLNRDKKFVNTYRKKLLKRLAMYVKDLKKRLIAEFNSTKGFNQFWNEFEVEIRELNNNPDIINLLTTFDNFIRKLPIYLSYRSRIKPLNSKYLNKLDKRLKELYKQMRIEAGKSV